MTSPTDATPVAYLPDPLPIIPIKGRVEASVKVPGSKSITNRALVCAALAKGRSTLCGALFADDTQAMLGVIGALGVNASTDPEAELITIDGCDGRPPASEATLDVRQSGTTARFALPLVTLAEGTFRVGGHAQMLARPMGPTLDAIRALGVPVEELAGAGHLPVTVRGGWVNTGVVQVRGDASSQFLSGLLLVGPCLPEGLVVEVTTELVSRPYVELTVAVMAAFGARVESPDPFTFIVAPGGYRAIDYQVEPDATAASYPLAAAAICGGTVRVQGLGSGSRQGDTGFTDVLASMGADVEIDDHGTTVVSRGPLRGGSFDFTHISDTAQTLAAVAVFAQSRVTVRGIGFIRVKETDRVTAVTRELTRCGIEVAETDDGWTITPGLPRPTQVHTYQDHRMAMSFALIGLRAPGIEIIDPGCVAKTFPGYFAMLDQIRASAVR